MKDVIDELKTKLPNEKVKLLESSIDANNSAVHNDAQVSQNNLSVASIPQKIQIDLGSSKMFNVRKGMSLDEEAQLMQMILDCGGILKTMISTHDINLQNNVFLQNLFSLSRNQKKECHEISNNLLSLSSKMKSVH